MERMKPVACKPSSSTVSANEAQKSQRESGVNNLRKLFAGVSEFHIGTQSTLDWKDSMITSRDHLDVAAYHNFDQKHKSEILITALESLVRHVSLISVGSILVGAWGLRSPRDPRSYLFSEPPRMLKEGTSLSTLTTSIIHTSSSSKALKAPDARMFNDWEMSATYLCASVLRLMRKDENSYIKAWDHIKMQYRHMYGKNLCIDFQLDLGCVKIIRMMFHNRDILRDTFAPFLLAYPGLEGPDQGIASLLFEQHLIYTGMPAYSLLLSCARELDAKPDILLGLMDHHMARDAIKAAQYILRNYEFPSSEEGRKDARENRSTWRYARIFDTHIFGDLQGKRCQFFMTVMVHLSKRLGMTHVDGMLGVRNMSQSAFRDICENIVEDVLSYVRVHKDDLKEIS